MYEIALDTETTGLDPSFGHRLVEIGCVKMRQGVPTGEVFHLYLNPERDVPPDATRVHGLTGEFLSDKPLFRDIVDGFLEFIGDFTLVIHNAPFDMKFLNHELQRVARPALSMTRVIDTLEMARKRFPGAPNNLDALCKRFNIDLSRRVQHGALLDAELLTEVYLELTGGRQSTLTLESEAETVVMEVPLTPSSTRPARQFAVHPEEETAHAAFVATLKDPIWRKAG
jgi:DNA polymerase-3 subunit epsilon